MKSGKLVYNADKHSGHKYAWHDELIGISVKTAEKKIKVAAVRLE